MAARLIIHRPGSAPEACPFVAPVSAGGSKGDGVQIEGAPRAAVRLRPHALGALAQVRLDGVRAAGRPLRPGTLRLLRPGERVELTGWGIELEEPPRPDGTVALGAAMLRQAATPGGAPIVGPHLLVLVGPDAGRRFALDGFELVAGRGRHAEVRLSDPEVSRHHARFSRTRRGIEVEDLSSKNGVRVNGAPIGAGPFALRAGDRIGLGDTELELRDEGVKEPDPRPLPVEEPAPPPEEPRRRARPRALPLVLAAALLTLGAMALAFAAA